MASLMGTLYRMLKDGDLEQRIAASIVVGEMAPHEKTAVELLGAATTHESDALRRKAIEALGKIGTPPARQILFDLLGSEGEIGDVTARAIARTGNPVVGLIKKAIPEASHTKLRTFLHVLAALRTREAMELLLDIVQKSHVNVIHDATQIFRQETGALESKESRQLSAQIRAAIHKKGFAENRSALEAALTLLSHLRDPASAPVLLEFSAAAQRPEMRRIALNGLRWVLPGSPDLDGAVRTLLGYLEEDDFPNVVSPALEALLPLDMPAAVADPLIGLAESRHPLVRKFALTKMSKLGQPRVIRTLAAALADSDPMIRELASRSLQSQPGAWKVVVEALGEATDVDLAWRMVHAVKAGSKIPADALKAVSEDAISRLEANDPMAEPMLNLVRTLAPRLHFDALYARGLHWKKKKKFQDAERCLKPLTRNEFCSDDARFELAVVALKNSNATAGAITRDSDLALSLVKALVRDPKFPIVKRLMAEKRLLDPEDYYYLGFHLVEGPPEERAVGADILQRIVKATPRSKVGKSARSKLRIEGLV